MPTPREFLRFLFPRTALVSLLIAAAAGAQSHKVSGDLVLSPATLGGDLEEARFTPDGSRLVYRADGETAGTVDLYSVPSDGSSAAVRLSAASPEIPSSSVEVFEISPDGEWVVFHGEFDFRLSSAPVDGSALAVQLDEFQAGFGITPDSAQVVWLDDEALQVAPIDGSAAPTVLSAGEGLNQIHQLGFSADGTRAVLAARTCYPCSAGLFSVLLDGSEPLVSLSSLSGQEFALVPGSDTVVFPDVSGGTLGLYAMPIDGSAAPILLSGDLFEGPIHLALSPDGERVVYSDGVAEVYSAPVDGSAAPVKLNGPLVAGGRLVGSPSGTPPFQLTPDGARVVYRADQLVDGLFELFSTPIGGGAWTKMSGTLVAGGDVSDFQVSPDSIGVLFRADRDVDDLLELYGAPFSGGVFQLSTDPVLDGDVLEFQITPDDAYVVYRGDLEVNVREELFSVPITGGPSTKLNGTLAPGGEVAQWSISPDSSRVAYQADEEVDELLELFCAPVDGDDPASKLNAPLDPGPPSGHVLVYEVTADSSSVVYVADGDVEGVLELYAAPVQGGSVIKLNGALVVGGGLSIDVFPPMRVSLDGARVVYLADQETNEQMELYSVPVDGSQPPIKLNQMLLSTGDIGPFELSADGVHVVYVSYRISGIANLFSVPVTGGEAPIQLNATSGQNVALPFHRSEFHVSPGGTHVGFRSGDDLYAAPVDGSQAAVKVSGPFGPGGGIGSVSTELPTFQLSPDGGRIVYLADARVDERYELYSARTDGSSGPARLSGPMTVGGDVIDFGISPDGKRVVYMADQEVNDRYELFSVPIDGARAVRREDGTFLPGRVKLNPTLVNGQSVGLGCCGHTNFVFSPDGSRVLFTAETIDTSHSDLFNAAIDGSELVQLTSGENSVKEFRFSPDGGRVVYLASGIYSTLADGSSPAVGLFLQGTSGQSDERQFVISPDGQWVVNRVDANENGQFELFARPIDGSQSAIQLNAPLVAEGDIATYHVTPAIHVTPDSGNVVYGADQDFDGVFELFASPLPALP